jgi:hypothetical protein
LFGAVELKLILFQKTPIWKVTIYHESSKQTTHVPRLVQPGIKYVFNDSGKVLQETRRSGRNASWHLLKFISLAQHSLEEMERQKEGSTLS